MAWARLDGRFAFHPKRRQVDVVCDGVWVRALALCAEYETDGFVDERFVHEQLAPRSAKQRRAILSDMVARRMLEPLQAGAVVELVAPVVKGLRVEAVTVTVGPFAESGYIVHDYLHWNPSKGEVRLRRDREREKKSAARTPPGVPGGVPGGQGNGGKSMTRRSKFGGTTVADPSPTPANPDAKPISIFLSPGDTPGCPPYDRYRSTTKDGGKKEVDARAHETASRSNLDATVTKVVDVLRQLDRLHVDRMAVENAVTAWPDCDPIVAARDVVISASDPACRWTNAGKLLFNSLQRQQQNGRTPRTAGNSAQRSTGDGAARTERFRKMQGRIQ